MNMWKKIEAPAEYKTLFAIAKATIDYSYHRKFGVFECTVISVNGKATLCVSLTEPIKLASGTVEEVLKQADKVAGKLFEEASQDYMDGLSPEEVKELVDDAISTLKTAFGKV